MREDGEVTYYALEAKYIDQDRIHDQYKGWFVHIDSDKCKYTKKQVPIRPANENDNPGASGYIWQCYGYNGVTNKAAAIRWLNRIVKLHEEYLIRDYPKLKDQREHRCKWRIVKITKSQRTTPILEMTDYGE